MGKSESELWLDVIVTTPESSFALGSVHVTVAVAKLLSVSWVISFGMPEITGLVVSVD